MTDSPHGASGGARRRVSAGTVFIGLALGLAVFVQTGPFATSDVLYGDLSYHEGVARTMAAGNIHGEGPFVGLASYYGGLFPLLWGLAARGLGVDFNQFVSVVSWFAVLAVPAAFYVLARRLWGDHHRAGVTAFVATAATGVSGQVQHSFAFGFLPASTNEWPLYPRDVALALIVLALAAMVGEREPSRVRLFLVGTLLAVTVATHVQFAMYGVVLVGGWTFATVASRRVLRVGVLLAWTGVLSSWWWLPRFIWTIDHGPLDLQSGPGIQMSSSDILLNLGWLLHLVLLGVVIDRHRRDAHDRRVLVWTMALVPALVFTVFVPDAGLITERRSWLFVGIPLVLVGGRGLWSISRRSRIGAAIVVVGMLFTAVLDMRAVIRFRDENWTSSAVGAINFIDEYWEQPTSVLRARVFENGRYSVVAGDADGLEIWARTGAQPYSAWLPGYAKTGFDLESMTGVSLEDRARELEEAFTAGLDGVCDLAGRIEADALVLRTDTTGVAVHDLRPASTHRSEQFPSLARELERVVGPGMTYRNRNAQETLALDPYALLKIPLAGTDVTTVEVRGVAGIGVGGSASLVVDGDVVPGKLIDDGTSKVFRFDALDLSESESVHYRGNKDFEVVRVLGFRDVAFDYPRVRDGVVVVERTDAC